MLARLDLILVLIVVWIFSLANYTTIRGIIRLIYPNYCRKSSFCDNKAVNSRKKTYIRLILLIIEYEIK